MIEKTFSLAREGPAQLWHFHFCFKHGKNIHWRIEGLEGHEKLLKTAWNSKVCQGRSRSFSFCVNIVEVLEDKVIENLSVSVVFWGSNDFLGDQTSLIL